ncbi:MAG TPA: NusA-like transcription termination signal-binding factor [Methanocorpusculum sp.]|nr:NusA-like transcription termination signal-binding factor [Methanocorpusculum sp.]
MERNLGFKERRYIEELRILTKSTAVDCVIDDRYDRIIYVIKKGDMGFAIGKNGDNIKKMTQVLGKRVEMVEFDEDKNHFIANMFKPAEVCVISFGEPDEPVRIEIIDKMNFGLAIGKGGSTIEKARLLVRRFFNKNISDLEVLENNS